MVARRHLLLPPRAPQDLDESKSNVATRIGFIAGEVDRYTKLHEVGPPSALRPSPRPPTGAQDVVGKRQALQEKLQRIQAKLQREQAEAQEKAAGGGRRGQ